jgi:glycosyltransferase involved in cell wall biosynthesis
MSGETAMSAIYVSYDGALDPLGTSQVVPYVVGLAARGVSMTLVSFEKPERWSDSASRVRMQRRLEASGIRWRPITYHKRPRTGGTLWDLIVGGRVIAREAGRRPPALVHCRGDLATAMARWSGVGRDTPLLYDMRGLFADERVETGSWRRGSLLDRAVRRIESANAQRARAVVVLTRRAAAALRRRCPTVPLLRVIPTGADLSAFTPRAAGQKAEYGLVYSGSLGTWYMAAEMLAFARAAVDAVPGPALFLTPQPEEIRRHAPTPEWPEVRTVAPGDVAGWLRRAAALFFFIRPIPSKRASCPTKFAEALASGLPAVCNRGIGDLDDIVENERVGVLVDDFSEQAYVTAARRLRGLLEEPGLSERCRELAEARYGVEHGVGVYHELYEMLAAAASRRRSAA